MKPKPHLRAVIYARQSSDEETASIENQVDRCQHYCKSMAYEVVAVFEDEGWSGTTLRRPGFEDMLKYAMSGKADLLIATGLDRFARTPKFLDMIEESFLPNGIGFVALDHGIDVSTAAGRLMLGMMLVIFRFYADQTSEKIISANESMRRRGTIRKFGYPFGTMRDPEKGGRIQNPDTWPVLLEIFDRVAAGEKMLPLARELQARGVPTASGKGKWHQATIRSIVSARFYIGEINHKNEVYLGIDGKPIQVEHECIIDRAVWEKANDRLHKRGRPTLSYTFLLDGLVRSSHWILDLPKKSAGKPVPFPQKMNHGQPYYKRLDLTENDPYYAATPDALSEEMDRSLRAPELEAAVLEKLEQVCAGGAMLQRSNDLTATQREEAQAQLAQAQVQFEKKKKELEDAREVCVEACLNRYWVAVETLNSKLGTLEVQLEVIKQTVSDLEKKVKVAVSIDTQPLEQDLNVITELRRQGKTDALIRLLRRIIDYIDVRVDGGMIYFKPGLKQPAAHVENKICLALAFIYRQTRLPRRRKN